MILYQYFLVTALILCFFLLKRQFLKFFCQFLFGVCLFEGLGKYFKIHLGFNTFIYNAYFVFVISYYIYIFNLEISIRDNSHKGFFYLISFWIICGAGFFYYQNINILNSIAYNLGMLLVIFLILKYFYLMVLGENYTSLLTIPHFWLASGILLFYSSAFPILSFTNIFITYDIQLARAFQKWVQYGNLFIAVSYNLVILCTYFKKV